MEEELETPFCQMHLPTLERRLPTCPPPPRSAEMLPGCAPVLAASACQTSGRQERLSRPDRRVSDAPPERWASRPFVSLQLLPCTMDVFTDRHDRQCRFYITLGRFYITTRTKNVRARTIH